MMLKHYKFLEKISKMLDRALDAEETNDFESIDLLYEVSELLEKEIKDFTEEKVFKKCERCHAKKLDLEQENKRLKEENKRLRNFLKIAESEEQCQK